MKGVVRSAIAQWDREFGASYPDPARKHVLDVPTRLAVYARIAHALIHPDNGYCNQCGGFWLYRTDGTWEYTDGKHTPDCVFRRLVAEAETVDTAPAPGPLEVLLREARALLASNKGATIDVYQRSNDALRLLDKALDSITKS